LFSQNEITLNAIWNGEFRTERLQEIQHLNNGTEFSVFEFDRKAKETKIVAKKYKNTDDKRLVLSSSEIPALPYFETYGFSMDESKVLLGKDYKSQYRYSSSAFFYVYDFKTKKAVQIGDERIFNPTFSPNGQYVAYVFQNDLFVQDVTTAETTRITTDGKKNRVINGMSDWVYEEEFELVSAFEWNATSTHIAFLKFNESEVKEYEMPIYGQSNYPKSERFKYPKAGEKNSVVSAHMYSLKAKNVLEVNLKKTTEDYIPRLQWTNNPELLSIQQMNRKQDKLDIIFVNVLAKVKEVVYTEKDKAYVEVTDDLIFLENNNFIKTNEDNGYRHLYQYSAKGKLLNQITKGDWEITEFYGVHDDILYYQSTEKANTERHIYRINLDGSNKKCLSKRAGKHIANFNKDYSLFIDTFSNTQTPPQSIVITTKSGEKLNTLIDNSKVKEKLTAYSLPKKELKTIRINGANLNMWMVKPNNFDINKKYPVLLYQYSGPGSQMVSNSWNSYNDYWHQLLTNKGYIVACIDGRGTGYKGRDFKKMTQGQLGKLEAADQIAFAEELGKLTYVDASRIGIWGWSYGGFNALNSILKGNEVFKMCIAVAPVTHWKFYDTIYTERFLNTPQDNELGYDENSPLSHADKLKGSVLLVHGTADDNVHLQNTLAMVDAFTKANKQFDLAIYTDKNHGIYGGNTRLQLYTKMTNYILEKL